MAPPRRFMEIPLKNRLIVALLTLFCSGAAWAAGTTTGETPEVQFSSTAASDLRLQAQTLATPAAIYEYVRNNHDYALYHGSRGGSVNTYLGLRGNDVDLASTLIAMYRSQGIPARYAVGTVRATSADAMNWLGVQNADLAASIMKDQGIQAVLLSADKSTVDFEHVWVEALVPYANYRGAGPDLASVNCQTQPASCHWIALDPSYKLRQYKGNTLDPYSALNFDYTAYYNAIKNQDAARQDKNPLEIYQEQILGWLRTTAPGKTLEDVADPGTIIAEQDGILPASLPYAVIGSIRNYNAVADHDAAVPAAEPKKWGKTASLRFDWTATLSGGGTLTVSAGAGPVLLADISTKRLTVTSELTGGIPNVVVRLDGVEIARPISGGGTIVGYTPAIGDPFTLTVSMDGTPSPSSTGTDQTISASYAGIVGGYYVLATGGETSNWSQVHRAAQQLLDANRQYPVVFNAAEAGCLPGGMNCTPYVDVNGNGWDATDPKLLDYKPALDALTGGLLNVAATQYYAKLRDQMSQADALNRVKTPIAGFLGVVSSTHQVEYIDGTAFSVLPGGLLIDMKGITITGTWRIDQPATFSNSHFEFVGHVVSSLEHEIWQELTGYDAISTVRGIQMALANNATLLTPKKNATTDTAATMYASLGFGATAPAGFTLNERTIFATRQASWAYATATSTVSFDVLKPVPSGTTDTRLASLAYYNDYTDGNLNCFYSNQNQLTSLAATYGWSATLNATNLCGFAVTAGMTIQQAYNGLSAQYTSYRTPSAAFYNYLDENQGFVPSAFVYRSYPAPASGHPTAFVRTMRNYLYLTNLAQSWVEYVVPSIRTVGPTYKFSVDIQKVHDAASGNLTSATFEIQNNTLTAGGGYVEGTTLLTPAKAIAGTATATPTFNNATLNDQTVVSEVNNDRLRTASTADPVSTVTGNNYHDETDIAIRGRGLNIAFTRTYNSTPAATKTLGPLGYGWTHSYAMHLKSNDFGACPNCGAGTGPGLAPENGNAKTASITYTDERGGDHNYLVNETTFAVSPPQGEFDTLAFDTPVAGQHTLTFRNGTQYIFEGPSTLKTTPNVTARLKTIQDAYGNQLNFTYDASGRLANIADNLAIAGRTGLTLGYAGAATQIGTITDWSGRTWTFGYDASNNLASATNPLSKAIQYTYAPGSHNLQDVILPELRNGLPVKTTFSYYRNGKAFNYQNALGQTETLDYDLYRKTTRVTDPRGGIRQYEYDSSGRMTKLIEPDGAALLFENSADGLRNKKYDGLGYATAYSYRNDKALAGSSDAAGNVTREQDPLGFTLDYAYGTFDQIASVTDKLGRITGTSYYTAAGACAVIGKPNTVSINTLNGVANVALRTYCWNSDGTLASQKDYIDATRFRTTSYTYQAGSNGLNVQSVTVTGSDGSSTSRSYTYDSLGRKQTETLARRTSATNAALVNLTTTTQYDALDRITRVTDAVGNIAETLYDANGQASQINAYYKKSDGTFDTRTLATRSYDQADRLASETDVYGNATTYAYDNAGNLIQTVDANGHITRYEYDAMNRRTAVIDANGYRTTTAYDLAGHPIAVSRPPVQRASLNSRPPNFPRL